MTVVNTHTHLDHLGGNNQFGEIMMFDHPRSRGIARDRRAAGNAVLGVAQRESRDAAMAGGLRAGQGGIAAFRRLAMAEAWRCDRIGGIRLKVLHTPGEAPDHICLLDETHRILFSGDILLEGAVWSHLDGGDVRALRDSYELLMRHYDEFDFLMPCHNAPCQSKELLPIALAGAEAVLSRTMRPQEGEDPWGAGTRNMISAAFRF